MMCYDNRIVDISQTSTRLMIYWVELNRKINVYSECKPGRLTSKKYV